MNRLKERRLELGLTQEAAIQAVDGAGDVHPQGAEPMRAVLKAAGRPV